MLVAVVDMDTVVAVVVCARTCSWSQVFWPEEQEESIALVVDENKESPW